MSWGTKKCKDCKVFKPVREYSRSTDPRAKVSGLKARCKACESTYQKRYRLQNAKKAFNPPAEKKCSRCQRVRPAACFHRSRSSPDGLNYLCRRCSKAAYAEYHPRRADAREKNLWVMYRITAAEYEGIIERQRGKCPICSRDVRAAKGKGFPPVDHDHESGRVRGVLCHKCNLWLGILEQMEAGALERIAKYLA